MEKNILNDIKCYMPPYLLQDKDATAGFIKNLENFPDNTNYYTSYHYDDELQGDGWSGLDIVNIETLKTTSIKGIILSNSCDISPENKRDIPTNIIFAPIIKLDMYKDKLIQSGISKSRIDSKIDAIKKQRVTSLFYLPKLEEEFPESIVVLDDVRSLPINYFQNKKLEQQTNKIFTLSQFGFYLFLIKISIHFCRSHEKILRDNPSL
ncbi:hypothetical protein PL75_01150 [Neisseria arctica]|uniref:Uncharacterized protein n=1 Tax=Neisseria arctica TaxID=1470200 RepID=A0A0J1C5J0_9NEIS|nr:hypothetical protein [Neisseria arctica]KLT73588.1 hypothetical protein PL75_01150 [Neisseria arctica]UOO85708.1 hypothetical protein LVJ86_05560 [Neisseria arctica]